jgi:hypothetical protein
VLETRASKEEPVQVGGFEVTCVAGVLGRSRELLVREPGGDVEDGAPGAHGGDVELNPEIAGFEGAGAVGVDVRATDVSGGGHLGDLRASV